jgi:dTMP kinase
MAGTRGRFISFEGGEGAGKSTQAKLLREALQSRGHATVLTREPGGSPGAEEIRKLLVEGAPERWDPLAETLLFIAARADHVARTIEPALVRGEWVISDRFADSTYVYQGIARGLGVDVVRRLQLAALGDFAPDLTIILDLDPVQGLRRAEGRNVGQTEENRFERFDAEFHTRLRDGFRALAAHEPQRCVLFDASRPAASVAADIWAAVSERFVR